MIFTIDRNYDNNVNGDIDQGNDDNVYDDSNYYNDDLNDSNDDNVDSNDDNDENYDDDDDDSNGDNDEDWHLTFRRSALATATLDFVSSTPFFAALYSAHTLYFFC